jgi:archaeal flagellar protein FlaJ
MKFKLKIGHYVGIVIGILTLIFSFIIFYPINSPFLKPFIAVGVAIILIPFWIEVLKENSKQREIEEKFLEFVRSITGNVRAGTPIPKSIIEAASSNYGALSPFIKKLSFQIEWGIPFKEALSRFATNTGNKVIRRAVSIITEAEKSGGNIQDVLEGVTSSVVQIEKINNERRTNAFSQLIQGYLVFFIFIGIMVVLQIFLLPQLADVSGDVFSGLASQGGKLAETGDAEIISVNFENIFIFLILVQGLFAGLMIGKFADGSIRYGVKHSFILMLIGYIIFTVAISIF